MSNASDTTLYDADAPPSVRVVGVSVYAYVGGAHTQNLSHLMAALARASENALTSCEHASSANQRTPAA